MISRERKIAGLFCGWEQEQANWGQVARLVGGQAPGGVQVGKGDGFPAKEPDPIPDVAKKWMLVPRWRAWQQANSTSKGGGTI